VIIAAFLILIGGAYWFCRHRTFGQHPHSTDNAYIQAESVIVSPKVAGYVERVLVTQSPSG
jgi:membrane fusion protein (multidrug efflux system)